MDGLFLLSECPLPFLSHFLFWHYPGSDLGYALAERFLVAFAAVSGLHSSRRPPGAASLVGHGASSTGWRPPELDPEPPTPGQVPLRPSQWFAAALHSTNMFRSPRWLLPPPRRRTFEQRPQHDQGSAGTTALHNPAILGPPCCLCLRHRCPYGHSALRLDSLSLSKYSA